MRVVCSPVQEKPMSLSYGGDLASLHGLFQLLEGFLRNQLRRATLAHPAHQEFVQTLSPVGDELSLVLTPTVAQDFGRFSQARTSPNFRNSNIFTR